jgi:UDP-N-acetylmuramoylalanine--D-glutamate ligase
LIGESKEKLRAAFGGLVPIDVACDLEGALTKAFNKAQAGDCVLLSPMCKSFDMFTDYEERGRVFKKAVSGLVNNRK